MSPSILDQHNVRVVGSSPQHVILCHGFGTDQSCWRHIVPLLEDEYTVVLFDLMGACNTNPDNFKFDRYATLHAYAEDLLNILEELDIEECIYVGHSVSGMIGYIASIAQPELFTKLVTISASPRYLNDGEYYGGFEQLELDQLFSAMQHNFRAWVNGYAPLAVGADLDSPAVEEFARTFFYIRPDIGLSVAKSIFQSDMRRIIPQVTVPCHILQSSRDLAVPVVVAQYLQQNVGGKSIIEIFSTYGHLPHLSAPEIVIPVLKRHLRSNL